MQHSVKLRRAGAFLYLLSFPVTPFYSDKRILLSFTFFKVIWLPGACKTL